MGFSIFWTLLAFIWTKKVSQSYRLGTIQVSWYRCTKTTFSAFFSFETHPSQKKHHTNLNWLELLCGYSRLLRLNALNGTLNWIRVPFLSPLIFQDLPQGWCLSKQRLNILGEGSLTLWSTACLQDLRQILNLQKVSFPLFYSLTRIHQGNLITSDVWRRLIETIISIAV